MLDAVWWFSAGENLKARFCSWFSAGENLKARFCPSLARYRARPDITKRQIAHCSTNRCLTSSGGGELLFVVLCRREPKGRVLSEVSSLHSQAGHKVKCTVLAIPFLVMFVGSKCDALADAR